jgi:uncharacterized protein DUF5648
MTRIWLVACFSLALLALTLFNPKTEIFRAQASPAPAPESVAAVPLYWFTEAKWKGGDNNYHDLSSQMAFHFYTINEDEKAVLQKQPQWTFNGVIGYVFPKPVPGTVPLYRLVKNEYDRVNHFMTIDKAEVDKVINGNYGWQSEGIVCYVSPKPVPGTVPLYRLYYPEQNNSNSPNKGWVEKTSYWGDVHFYTTDGQAKYSYIYAGFQPLPVSMYVWSHPTSLNVGGNVIKPPQPPPAASAKDQLFSLGCAQDANKQIKCPSVQGLELCNFYKSKGQINATSCATSADQSAFANLEHDLSARGCTRFLGRAGQYLCQTLNGAQACQGYLKKGDGLVTKCISVKQAQMAKDLFGHGCKSFLGRDDDYYCSSADGLKLCNNYRLDGQIKTCRQQQ